MEELPKIGLWDLYSSGTYVLKVKAVERGHSKAGYPLVKVFIDGFFPPMYWVDHPNGFNLYRDYWLFLQGWLGRIRIGNFFGRNWVLSEEDPPEDPSWLVGRELVVRLTYRTFKDHLYPSLDILFKRPQELVNAR